MPTSMPISNIVPQMNMSMGPTAQNQLKNINYTPLQQQVPNFKFEPNK